MAVRKLKPKDPSSPWVCEYNDEKGKRHRYTPKTGLKKDADAFRKKMEAELERGVHVAHSATVTLSEASKLWIAECEKRKGFGELSIQTFITYRGSANRVVELIGAMKLPSVTQEVAQRTIDDLATRYAPRTVLAGLMALFHILDAAVAAKYLKINPLNYRRLRLPRKERAAKIPTREEIEHILFVSGQRKRNEQERTRCVRHAMFCLALFSTLRRGEVCGLRWSDVDLAKGVIRINQSRSAYETKGPKTKAGIRATPLPPIVLSALNAIPGPRGEYVFTRRGGNLPNPGNLHLHWYYLAAKAGLSERRPGERFGHAKPRYRFHDLRHAAASLLIAEGANPLHVQRAMGHASVTTTLSIYGHLFDSDDTIKKAADAISAGFEATKTRHAETAAL